MSIADAEQAIAAVAAGQMVVVSDAAAREDEGDLIMAADCCTTDALAFFVRHTSGLICASITEERADELQLPLMVASNTEAQRTAFTVTVDLRNGTSTGISAKDRAATVRSLADAALAPSDLNRPGHVQVLRAREGGVLQRPGHTEAAVDLARSAGRYPAGVLCEIVTADKTDMARGPELRRFAREHDLPMVTIADLIAYRRRNTSIIEHVSEARLPTPWGEFRIHTYCDVFGTEHIALVLGDLGAGPALVHPHRECLVSDALGSSSCRCGSDLHRSLVAIGAAGKGVVVYLRGREGLGLGCIGRAATTGPEDRDCTHAAQILAQLGVVDVIALTADPVDVLRLRMAGCDVVGRRSLGGIDLDEVNIAPAAHAPVPDLMSARDLLSLRSTPLFERAAPAEAVPS